MSALGAVSCPFQDIQSILAQGFIKVHLLSAHGYIKRYFSPWWKFFKDLRFYSSENERADQFFKFQPGIPVIIALNRYCISLVKLVVGSKQSRVNKIKEVPQFTEVILYRSTGCYQFEGF